MASQTEEAFGYAAEGKKFARENIIPEVTFKDAATFVAEMTPIVGDAIAAKEVYDEVTKEKPDWVKVGILAGAGAVALIPFFGDAAGKLIKKGSGYLKNSPKNKLKPSLNKNPQVRAKEQGFSEDMYHYTASNKINKDVFNPDISKGNWNRMGIHVGSTKAARDRFTGTQNIDKYEDGKALTQLSSGKYVEANPEGITLPLKVRTNKPLMFGDEVESEFSIELKLQKMAEERGLDPLNYAQDLRKQLADEGYTHIPYVNEVEGGEGSVSYIMLTDRSKKSPSVMRSKFAKFNPKKINKPELGFAQGGSTMNEQTEMAFMQQGGLKDDGMKRDPVSGNPVPNGSMAEEVRDDIPAQLSEGEYVVPADVVRYYGVKHFEDIRNKAKSGLQSMEANGRIGGEPVPVGGPKAAPMQQPPTPYNTVPTQPQQQMSGGLNQGEMNEIQSMMMAVGGFVEEPNNMQQGNTDPYQQQQTMYKQPMAMGAFNGTDVSGLNFTPGSVGPTVVDGSFSKPPTSQVPTQVTQTIVVLYSPDGLITRSLNLPADQIEYDNLIAQGYVTTKPTVAQGSSGGRRGGSGGTPGGSSPAVDEDWGKEVDWTKPDEYAQEIYDSLDNMEGAAKTVAGGAVAFGAPGLGVAIGIGTKFKIGSAISDLSAAAILAKAQGLSTKGIEEKIDNLLKRGGGLLQLGSYLGLMSGENKAQSALDRLGFQYNKDENGQPNFDDLFNREQTKYNSNLGSSSTTKTESATVPTSQQNNARAAATRRSQGIASQDMSGKSTGYKTAAAKEITKDIKSDGITNETTAADDTTAGGASLDTAYGITGLNKGGLMTSKKKKKTKKTKGK